MGLWVRISAPKRAGKDAGRLKISQISHASILFHFADQLREDGPVWTGTCVFGASESEFSATGQSR